MRLMTHDDDDVYTDDDELRTRHLRWIVKAVQYICAFAAQDPKQRFPIV